MVEAVLVVFKIINLKNFELKNKRTLIGLSKKIVKKAVITENM